MIHPAVEQFLVATADARDTTDVNIAAGMALEELGRKWPYRLKRVGATIAAIVAVTIVGDAFASSPVHAGISPIKTLHVFTRASDQDGVQDWGDIPHANVFGHDLPWRSHDGWFERLLGF